MKYVQIVPKEYINSIWDKVESYINNALEHSSDECDPEHVRLYLVQGTYFLAIAVDDEGAIHGAAVIEFINYPKQRVAFIIAIGGRLISTPELWEQLTTWFKSCGATKVRGAAREAISRLWRRAFKFKERYIIVEKDL